MEESQELQFSGTHVATAPFVHGAPSPPGLTIPALPVQPISILPSFDAVDSASLTESDLRIITQNEAQLARDNSSIWEYDMRREAQPILDFLYLGPRASSRDKDFLRREGITMLLGVLDPRMAQFQLLTMEKTARELGIAADHIDATSHQGLIRLFPEFVRKVNDHMLSIYRGQAIQEASGTHQIAIDPARFRRGKVLVFCDSGNERSALMVAGYIMNVFTLGVVRAVQFINCQRFCTNFNDESKRCLLAYQDILEARRNVAAYNREAASVPRSLSIPSNKRSIGDAYEGQDAGVLYRGGGGGGGVTGHHDLERWMDRDGFAPFMDGQATDFDMQ